MPSFQYKTRHMAPPKAKRFRLLGEDSGVAREETEPTSSRRTRSRYPVATEGDSSADTSAIEGDISDEANESTATSTLRRITRARLVFRGRVASADSPATSARTRPFNALTFAASTQTEDPARDNAHGNLGAEWESIAEHLRRTSSNSSVAGSPTPHLSDNDDTMEEVDVLADPPRERRAATQRALESLAEQHPQPAVRPTRASAVRARDATNRELAADRASGRRTMVRTTTNTAASAVVRDNVDDVGGLLEEIMGQLAPNILESFGDRLREGSGRRMYQFERDTITGRLNLVRGHAPAAAAAGDAASAAGTVPNRTVTTVRMDLQIDVGRSGTPVFDFDEIRRITDATRARRPVEQAARIRLDQLTDQEVTTVLHRVIEDCEMAANRQREARELELDAQDRAAAAARADARAARAAEAQAAAAAAEREGLPPPPVETVVDPMAELRMAVRNQITDPPSTTASTSSTAAAVATATVAPTVAVAATVPAAPAAPTEPAAAAAADVQPRTRAQVRLAAAAALTLSEVSPAPSPPADMDAAVSDDSHSATPTPPPVEEARDASDPPSSQRILTDLRSSVVRELRHIRRTRALMSAGAAPPPPPPETTSTLLNHPVPSVSQPAVSGGVELVGMELVGPMDNPTAPLEALRDHLFTPPIPVMRQRIEAVTTNRLREFIMYISGQASDNGPRRQLTAPFGGGPIDYRLRSIINAGNVAIAALVRRESELIII
ncbi:hypothetical protein PRIPAC_85523 [Pristionchus pacificus]|uniref:Uncharacterized protein n=1 Tax=Pristionchus pacificus TaxID=54126 RepID=A0A2A6BMK9_PRIPA|nr:hypothetical protein PRIPAC_85523 [Pristionchus pacificus]|eukprot:PDM67001.1 hypothetical protein PRIPAC_48418 [Pristionchus pacificus]